MKEILINAINKTKAQIGDIDFSLINLPYRVMMYITMHSEEDWHKLSTIYNKVINKSDDTINALRGDEAGRYAKDLIAFVESQIKNILKEDQKEDI